MFRYLLAIFVITGVLGDYYHPKPVYQYRYETEDVMKTDASSIPVRGYHVVQGGYYPQHYGGYSAGGGFSGVGGYGSGPDFVGGGRYISGPEFSGGYYPSVGSSIGGGAGFVGGGVGGYSAPYYHHGTGGEYVDKNSYSGGNKDFNGGGFEKASGSKGSEFSHGQEGYSEGKVDLKNSKGDAGYYSEKGGEKKAHEDGKAYAGGQHYGQEGKSEGEKKQKGSHKKGHVVKGFKTSHHKDENGKTEEFYDEAHDEGGSYSYGGQAGSFGEKAESAYKGGHDNGKFAAAEEKKEGHYDNHHYADNNNADKGHYGEKKYSENGEVYGQHNGIDQHSLLGHQEANKVFKHHPYHVPFFPVY